MTIVTGDAKPGKRARIGASLILIGLALIAVAGAWVTEWRWWLAGAVFAWGALLFLLWRRDLAFSAGWIVGVGIVLRLVVFPLPPALSDDAFRYLWDGILTAERVSPFAHRPSDPALERFHGLDLFSLLNSRDYYTVYPPASQCLFAVGGWLAGWNETLGLYAIKALLGLCELGALLLLARMVDSRKLLLYAWNPVVVLELWGQWHTEAIAVLGLAVCLRAWQLGKGGWAGSGLALAGWAKLYPLLLLPFLWRRSGWRAGAGAALVTAIVWAPFAAGFPLSQFKQSLDLYVISFEFNAGPYYLVKWLTTKPVQALGWIGPEADSSKILGPLLRYAFLGAVAAIYWKDCRWRLSFPAVAALVLMVLFATATTVHPWYVTPLLLLLAFCRHEFWSWHWLAVVSLGTYLFYSHGVYWPWVWLAWGGWLALFVWKDVPVFYSALMRQRGREKRDLLRRVSADSWQGKEILDLGAGEGYVGEWLRDENGAEVTLADVLDLNRSNLALTLYDGERLPFDDGRFDLVILVYVLHHCRTPEQVMREALRVSREGALVLESVHDAPWNHRLLRWLDRLSNRLRSRGAMRPQEGHVRFRTVEEWERLFRDAGARVDAVVRLRHPLHRKAVFRLGNRVSGIRE